MGSLHAVNTLLSLTYIIAQERPSRFDRKYLFANPNKEERTQYCYFWQRKLSDNKHVDFPDVLCGAIAGITDGFSFAYMQEAFVAALLAIARGSERDYPDVCAESQAPGDLDRDWVSVNEKDQDGGLEHNVLWIEIQQQIKQLRRTMGPNEP